MIDLGLHRRMGLGFLCYAAMHGAWSVAALGRGGIPYSSDRNDDCDCRHGPRCDEGHCFPGHQVVAGPGSGFPRVGAGLGPQIPTVKAVTQPWPWFAQNSPVRKPSRLCCYESPPSNNDADDFTFGSYLVLAPSNQVGDVEQSQGH